MKYQKGFTPILIVIAIVVVVVGAIGYGVINKGKGGSSLDANCKLKDPELCRFTNKTTKGGLFQTGFFGKTITTNKAGKKTESEFKLEKEGRSEFISWESGKETFHMISLDGVIYTKDLTDGKWIKMTLNTPTGTEKNQGF